MKIFKSLVGSVCPSILLVHSSAKGEAAPNPPEARQAQRDKASPGKKKKAEACTVATVNKLRTTEYKRFFDQKEFAEAADLLERFLKDHDCYSPLAFQEKKLDEIAYWVH